MCGEAAGVVGGPVGAGSNSGFAVPQSEWEKTPCLSWKGEEGRAKEGEGREALGWKADSVGECIGRRNEFLVSGPSSTREGQDADALVGSGALPVCG